MNFWSDPIRYLRDFFWVPTDPYYPDVPKAYELEHINKRLKLMALNFEKLAEQVKVIEDTQSSAITVIENLKAELKAVSEKLAASNANTEELDSLIEKLDKSTDALAAAIATNPGTPEG